MCDGSRVTLVGTSELHLLLLHLQPAPSGPACSLPHATPSFACNLPPSAPPVACPYVTAARSSTVLCHRRHR
jgi:hypothetical protein